jgi:hypothetical protein
MLLTVIKCQKEKSKRCQIGNGSIREDFGALLLSENASNSDAARSRVEENKQSSVKLLRHENEFTLSNEICGIVLTLFGWFFGGWSIISPGFMPEKQEEATKNGI